MVDYTLVRDAEDITRVMEWAMDGISRGTNLPGMTYEEGVVAMLDWLTGVTDDPPDD